MLRDFSSPWLRDANTPLVGRELLSLSRKAWTFWGRVVTSLGACLALAFLAMAGDPSTIGLTSGRPVMVLMFFGLYFFATIGGVRSTYNCISRERREGTLGLLFLTDLNSRSVLLAKLISSSFQNLSAMFAVFPILAICFVAGGVDGRLFVQATLAILLATWMSCTIGLYQTCVTEDDHEAFSKSVRNVILYNCMPLVSPFFLLLAAVNGGNIYFWLGVIPSFVGGWSFWRDARKQLARNWRGLPPKNRPPEKLVLKKPEPEPGLIRWIESTHSVFGKKCGDQDPNTWILSRYRDHRQVSPVAIGRVILIVSCLLLFVPLLNQDLDSFLTAYLVFMGCCRIIVIVAVCKIAPQGWADVLKGSGMEILLTTPLTVRSLIHSARKLLLGEFSHPLAIVLGADLLVLISALLVEGSWSVKFTQLLLTIGLTSSLFVVSLLALGSLGFWLGLMMNQTTSAVNTTFMVGLGFTLTTFYAGAPEYQFGAGVLLVECIVVLLASQYGVLHYLRKNLDGTYLDRAR